MNATALNPHSDTTARKQQLKRWLHQWIKKQEFHLKVLIFRYWELRIIYRLLNNRP